MRRSCVLLFMFMLLAGMMFADDWNKSYQVQGRPQLVVEADDGNVTISPGAGNTVALSVHTAGYRIAPGDIEVSSQQQGNQVQLTIRKHSSGFHLFLHSALEIRVSLPAESDLDVHTRDGNLDISGIHGTQRLRTGDGNAEIRGTSGALELETGDGNLNVDGSFSALSLRTGDGNMDAVARAGSAMKSSWTLRTGDGNIYLRLPENFSANLDAHTGDGHVRSDFPVTSTGATSSSDDRQDLRGTINGGGPILSLRTGDGTIEIRH